MSFSISGSGHIAEQESDGTTPVQTPAEIEAELAVKLHEALAPIAAQAKYGIGVLNLYSQHHGVVNLIAAPGAHADTHAPDPGDDEDED